MVIVNSRNELARMRGGGIPLRTILHFVRSNAPRMIAQFKRIFKIYRLRHNNEEADCCINLIKKKEQPKKRHHHRHRHHH